MPTTGQGACGQRHLCQVFPDLPQIPVFKMRLRKGNDLPKVRESQDLGRQPSRLVAAVPSSQASPCSALSPRNQPRATWRWPPHWTMGEDDNVLLTPLPTPAKHPHSFSRQHCSRELGGISELRVTMHRQAPMQELWLAPHQARARQRRKCVHSEEGRSSRGLRPAAFLHLSCGGG